MKARLNHRELDKRPLMTVAAWGGVCSLLRSGNKAAASPWPLYRTCTLLLLYVLSSSRRDDFLSDQPALDQLLHKAAQPLGREVILDHKLVVGKVVGQVFEHFPCFYLGLSRGQPRKDPGDFGRLDSEATGQRLLCYQALAEELAIEFCS